MNPSFTSYVNSVHELYFQLKNQQQKTIDLEASLSGIRRQVDLQSSNCQAFMHLKKILKDTPTSKNVILKQYSEKTADMDSPSNEIVVIVPQMQPYRSFMKSINVETLTEYSEAKQEQCKCLEENNQKIKNISEKLSQHQGKIDMIKNDK